MCWALNGLVWFGLGFLFDLNGFACLLWLSSFYSLALHRAFVLR